MKTKAYPLRISEEIVTISKLRAQEEHVDQSTALRQFMYVGAEEYLLELVEKGRLSIGKSAELLGVSIYDMHQLARKHGVSLGPTLHQAEESRKRVKTLFGNKNKE